MTRACVSIKSIATIHHPPCSICSISSIYLGPSPVLVPIFGLALPLSLFCPCLLPHSKCRSKCHHKKQKARSIFLLFYFSSPSFHYHKKTPPRKEKQLWVPELLPLRQRWRLLNPRRRHPSYSYHRRIRRPKTRQPNMTLRLLLLPPLPLHPSASRVRAWTLEIHLLLHSLVSVHDPPSHNNNPYHYRNHSSHGSHGGGN